MICVLRVQIKKQIKNTYELDKEYLIVMFNQCMVLNHNKDKYAEFYDFMLALPD
jgi:hypothetical protein